MPRPLRLKDSREEMLKSQGEQSKHRRSFCSVCLSCSCSFLRKWRSQTMSEMCRGKKELRLPQDVLISEKALTLPTIWSLSEGLWDKVITVLAAWNVRPKRAGQELCGKPGP